MLVASLILALAQAHWADAAQFTVSETTLTTSHAGGCAGSWGDTTLLVGSSGDNATSANIFVDGVWVGSANMSQDRLSCSVAAAQPGIMMVAHLYWAEFFNVSTRSFLPYDSTSLFPGPVYRENAAGSTTTSLVGAVSGAGVALVDVSTQSVVRTLSNGVPGATAVSMMDSNAREYMVFVGGSITFPNGVDTIRVLPVDAPTAFVAQASTLSVARNHPYCTVNSGNVLVCVGGRDGSGEYVDNADFCTISTAGVVTCATRTYNKNSRLASVGPFVLGLFNEVGNNKEVSAADTTALSPLVFRTYSDTVWSRVQAVASGRFAYGFGARGAGPPSYDKRVLIVECVAPCTLPLQGPTTITITSTIGGVGSTTSGTDSSTESEKSGAWVVGPTLTCLAAGLVHW